MQGFIYIKAFNSQRKDTPFGIVTTELITKHVRLIFLLILRKRKAGDFTDLASKGDCGFATAEDNGIWYSFTLQHAISYLTFMP